MQNWKLWKERSKNKADWEKNIRKAKVHIGLQCHLRRSEMYTYIAVFT
jgi:hypothetical protein